jgi:predicted amidohydrolase
MKYTLAVAQIDPVLGDLRRNVQKHAEFTERARARGSALVLFPELSLTGYTVRDMNMELALNLGEDRSLIEPLVDLSRSGISIVAGGIEEDAKFGIYNAAFLFEEGNVRVVHRKIYPPTYGMFEEMRYFARGKSVRAFDTKQGRLGVLICEDFWHISLPYLLALDGAEAILGLVASPTRIGPEEPEFNSPVVNSENYRVYARMLSVHLAVANRVGFEDGVNFWGGSQVVLPGGETLVTAKTFEEDLIVTEIDDQAIRQARRASRHFLDEDPGLVAGELSRMRTP